MKFEEPLELLRLHNQPPQLAVATGSQKILLRRDRLDAGHHRKFLRAAAGRSIEMRP
jgi:hypothetical protein